MSTSSTPHPRYRLYTTGVSYTSLFKDVEGATRELEAEVCRRFKVESAVCVPRARTGLYLTVLEMIRTGQNVVMSPLTIVDVVNAVILAGGIPVFADICRASCAIDPTQAETLINGKTGAILITHLHGESAGALTFREICNRRGVRLIEDTAQALGAIEGVQRLGTIGDAGIYSFGFFKNLSAWRGGMVVSNDRQLVERIRSRVRNLPLLSRRELLRTTALGAIVDAGTWPPMFSRFTYPAVCRDIAGINRHLDPEAGAKRLKEFPEAYLHRMRESQSALAVKQLRRLDEDSRARIMRAEIYHEGLENIEGIIKPPRSSDLSNIYTYFPIQISNRSRFLDYARRQNRDLAAQHLRNCADLSDFHEFHSHCPNARAAASELVLLPTYPRYPTEEIARNIEVLRTHAATS